MDVVHRIIKLRSASEFADQMNVHVNHLNREVNETTQKSTTEIIVGRIIKESKVLLKHGHRNVFETAYALHCKEATHFSNFFKKLIRVIPTQFRKV